MIHSMVLCEEGTETLGLRKSGTAAGEHHGLTEHQISRLLFSMLKFSENR